MRNNEPIISTTKLDSDEFIGIGIIEILSIPDVTILHNSDTTVDSVVTEYKRGFSSLLSEVYQTYREAKNKNGIYKDLSLELLWLTQEVTNQTFAAHIKLYLVVRTIDFTAHDVIDSCDALLHLCEATLAMQKYTYQTIPYSELASALSRVKEQKIRAIVKEERLEDLQNRILSSCFSFDKLTTVEQDLNRIVNSLINYPDSAVSFQLIPTAYTGVEIDTLGKMTQTLDTLSNGIMDHGVGNIRYSLANKHAETYKYYMENKNNALFMFNILVYGTLQSVANISTRVYGQLSTSSENNAGIKFVELRPDMVNKDTNFYPLPWAVNELLVNTERSTYIWSNIQQPDGFYRLPYIISADEASEFFRLPIGTDNVSAGLIVNQSSKIRKSYGNSIINGGDIVFGRLKATSNNDTIGISLADLTKHMLIVGTPGSGKTTFSISLLDRLWKEHNIPFLVIEPAKNEYRALVKKIPDLQIFTPGKNSLSPFVFNPFVPPKNVKLETYKSTLKTAFAAAVSMSTPLDKIFEESINNCYSDFRWLDSYTYEDKGRTFNISDFIKCFRETFDEIGYTGDAKNIGRAGVVRLNSLINLFDNYFSIPIEDLLQKPTIIELSAIENSDQKALIIALLLLSIQSYVNSNYMSGDKLRNIILLEEAHVLLAADINVGQGEADPRSIAIGLLKRMLAEIRAYGVGLLIADQSPRKVTTDVIALTDIKLAFRLVEATDKQILADSTNMSDIQVKRLAKLSPGEAFLFFNKLDEPEEIITDDYRHQKNIKLTLTDEEIKVLSTYWDDKKDKLKPYPECHCVRYCSESCDCKSRLLAKEVARRIFTKNFTSNTTEFDVLKAVFSRFTKLVINELPDEQADDKLLACIKLQLLRRVKYNSLVKLNDATIEATLMKA